MPVSVVGVNISKTGNYTILITVFSVTLLVIFEGSSTDHLRGIGWCTDPTDHNSYPM
ncbi:hypothetical protein GVC16_001588 [Salmonella enterica]|nr:hypothetical protein [Salmonella enterica]EDT6434431.1 hypothetical protein [Salmonella enterica subsp. enterica]EDW6357007.1 hypothetical protein [Salmonella enterica subsp. enterica serovar Sandiego]